MTRGGGAACVPAALQLPRSVCGVAGGLVRGGPWVAPKSRLEVFAALPRRGREFGNTAAAWGATRNSLQATMKTSGPNARKA
jgi:hypothetical protein